MFPANTARSNDVPKNTGGVPTPATLNRALSRTDDLNSRLYKLGESVREIALAIGGPWPTADSSAPPPCEAPALHVLNDRIDRAHDNVTDIEAAVQAIRRSLEG